MWYFVFASLFARKRQTTWNMQNIFDYDFKKYLGYRDVELKKNTQSIIAKMLKNNYHKLPCRLRAKATT